MVRQFEADWMGQETSCPMFRVIRVGSGGLGKECFPGQETGPNFNKILEKRKSENW